MSSVLRGLYMAYITPQVGCWHRPLQRRLGAESAEGHSGGFCGDLLCGESQGQRGEEFGGDTGHGFFYGFSGAELFFFWFFLFVGDMFEN